MAFDVDNLELPEWTRWIAQDQDGIWWAYEIEPLQFDKGWYENEVGRNKRLEQVIEDKIEIKNWKNSLMRVKADK